VKRLFAVLALAAAAAPLCAQPVAMEPQKEPPRPQRPLTVEQAARIEKSKLGGAGVLAFMKAQRDMMKKAGFSGETGVAHYVNLDGNAGSGSPFSIVGAQDGSGKVLQAGRLWRWASVTKQVIAVLIMQEVVAGRVDLDKSVSKYLPDFQSPNAKEISVRQLLRHQTGLPNPDDTPTNADGVPSFYTSGYSGNRDPMTGYCAGPQKAKSGDNWAYNNCDYIVAGALLEKLTGKAWQALVEERLTNKFRGLSSIITSPPTTDAWPGFNAGKPESSIDIKSYGAAGSIYGEVSSLLWFDIYLAAGALLPQTALAELWDGKPELGFLALGQWSFDAPLKGCDKPVRIIERRGAIGGVQVRNLIVPDREIAVALFTDQAEFEFGEIWQGSGFSYDMLSLATCAKVAA
jgi:D-alanyl-D-alanine carboxypeptidase